MAAERSRPSNRPREQRTTVKFRAVRTIRPEAAEDSDPKIAVEVERKGGSGEYCFVLPPELRRKKPKSR